MFAKTSFWNMPLPANAPIDPNSASYITQMVAQVAAGHAYINTDNFTHPLYYVPASQPLVTMTLDRAPGTDDQLATALAAGIPIPTEARTTGPFTNGDNHLAIYQPSSDTYWETWSTRQFEVDGPHPNSGQSAGATALSAPGWHCLYGAIVQNASASPGVFNDTSYPGVTGKTWGASGSSLFIAGGDITVAEAMSLYIPHALFAAVNNSKQTLFRWPALRTDGSSSQTWAPLFGMLFRLPPTFDLSTVSDPLIRAIAKAVRDFGFYIADTGGDPLTFYGEPRCMIRGSESYAQDPWFGPTGPNHPGAIFTNFPDNLMVQFPVSSLQVVDASYRPGSVAPGRMI